MRIILFKLTLLAVTCIFIQAGMPAQDNSPKHVKSEPYVWKNVQIVGGGFVDGIIFHPTEKNLRYCRTDMGGAYRWDQKNLRWQPLLDWISYADLNLMGVESIALDPNDPDMLFMACGTYTNPSTPDGAILWSDDRGKTFHHSNLPVKFGGNENGRGNGERLAVDPNNSNILYLGTRHAGLWRSTDRAKSWSPVNNFPDITEKTPDASQDPAANNRRFRRSMGSGIVFVVFDPASGSKVKGSSVMYVGVSLMGQDNFFMSDDAGKSWIPVPGHPQAYRPGHCVRASDGTLYLSYGTDPGPGRMNDGAIWKYIPQGAEWTNITPDKPEAETTKLFGYGAVAVDASDPKVIIASTFGRPWEVGGEEIFRSTDGGKSWKPLFKDGAVFDYSKAPYVAHTGIHWMLDLEIDPCNPAHAMVTTGYGGHETFNLTDADAGKKTTWEMMSTGIDETVALELLSPPAGGQVITAIGDYCGFVHHNLDVPEPGGCFENPHFGNTNGIACAWLTPEILVRVGVVAGGKPGVPLGYSTDGGKNWTPADSSPAKGARLGHIAVSSDGASWVWTPERMTPFLTRDRGRTWTPVEGLPLNIRVVADRVNANQFYAVDLFGGKLFISNEGGTSFSETPLILPDGLPAGRNNRGDSRGGQDRIYSTPGVAGDLWLASFNGLYHSAAIGNPFAKMKKITEIHAFGFGKEAPGKDYPALYLIGTVQGQRGIFRSDNAGEDWIRINDDQHQWGLLLHITGDPKKYGRVYVGTHGRGTVYGDPR